MLQRYFLLGLCLVQLFQSQLGIFSCTIQRTKMIVDPSPLLNEFNPCQLLYKFIDSPEDVEKEPLLAVAVVEIDAIC